MPRRKQSKQKGGDDVVDVVIDNGNGNTEAVKVTDSGRNIYTSFSSMRAQVSGDDFDDDDDLEDEWEEFDEEEFPDEED